MGSGKKNSEPTQVTISHALTPLGVLPMEDIREAGFEWNDSKEIIIDWETGKMVLKPLGFNTIPSQVYYSQGDDDGKNAGIKYTAPSQRFLAWRAKYISNKKKDDVIKRMGIQKELPKLEKNGIDIKSMEF